MFVLGSAKAAPHSANEIAPAKAAFLVSIVFSLAAPADLDVHELPVCALFTHCFVFILKRQKCQRDGRGGWWTSMALGARGRYRGDKASL
jgi:hypothetical protein